MEKLINKFSLIIALLLITTNCQSKLTLPCHSDEYGRRLLCYESLTNEKSFQYFIDNDIYLEFFQILNKALSSKKNEILVNKNQTTNEYITSYNNFQIQIYFSKNNIKPMQIFKKEDEPLVYCVIYIKNNKITYYKAWFISVQKDDQPDIILFKYLADKPDIPFMEVEYYYKLDSKFLTRIKNYKVIQN